MRDIINIISESFFYSKSVSEGFEQKTSSLTPYHEPGLSGYSFTIDAREFFVGFKGSDGDYYMSFTGSDDRGRQSALLLGHDNPIPVFNRVMSAIMDFIHKNDPDQIEFSVDDRETKRVSTYDKMFEAMERKHMFPDGYVWDRDGNHNYFIFKDGYR